MIVATAGHIDHGKTVLVKALTGVDADRLPEEKRRGLTIDLGFAYLPLPGGTVLSFIDVPGHERFIRNMLAGVIGIDFALLVVAADDGPMPQTHEHLAILDLLGVSRGAVALTKIDRVDPVRVSETAEAVRDMLAGTTLADAPVFPLSGQTGEGVPALRAALDTAAQDVADRTAGGNFRLAVDRCFTIAGSGLVVTGTVFSGTVRVGDRLMLSPAGVPVRVRGIHAQNREAEIGRTGDRCALNIAGADLRKTGVGRGDWVLAEAAHAPVRRIDARVRALAGEEMPLRHWMPVHVHLGAADVTGRVAVLEGRSAPPGGSALVQLLLDRPVGAVRGDRLILRDQSARHTLAGGHVLDPFPPARGRARPERLAHLSAMAEKAPEAALRRLLDETPAGVDLHRFARAWNLNVAEAAALWLALPMTKIGRPEAPTGIAPARLGALRAAVLATLKAWHVRLPAAPGPDEARLRRGLPDRISPVLFNAVLLDLVREGQVAREGASLRLAGHRAAMSAEDSALWERVRPLLEEGDLRPPRLRELAEALEMDLKPVEAFMARAARLGLVLRVADNRYYPPEAMARLGAIAEALAAENADGLFDAAAFRDRSGIGRNLAIKVLEFFDKTGFTRRTGEGRRILKPVAEVFPAS